MAQPVLKESPQHQVVHLDHFGKQKLENIKQSAKEALNGEEVDVTPETEKDLKLRQEQAREENEQVLEQDLYKGVWKLKDEEGEESKIGDAGAKLIDAPDELPPQDGDSVVDKIKQFFGEMIPRTLARRPGPYYASSAEFKEEVDGRDNLTQIPAEENEPKKAEIIPTGEQAFENAPPAATDPSISTVTPEHKAFENDPLPTSQAVAPVPPQPVSPEPPEPAQVQTAAQQPAQTNQV